AVRRQFARRCQQERRRGVDQRYWQQRELSADDRQPAALVHRGQNVLPGCRVRDALMNAAAAPPDDFQQALALLESDRILHAQAAFEEILRKQPRHADALHLLGLIAARSNDPKKAAVLIGKSVQMDPGNPVAYLNRGAVLQELEQWEEAFASYKQALTIHPDFAAVYFNR